jgi:MFS family permease
MGKIIELRRFINRYDRRLWTLLFVRLIIGTGFGTAMPFVSLYLYQELGISMKVVGTMMLVTAAVSSVGRIMGGELADRFGRKLVIVLAIAVWSLVFLGMAYLVAIRAHYLLVALAFIGIRFSGSITRPAIQAMLADISDPELRVEAYGLLRIGGNTGWAIGPALGGFLLNFSYSVLFMVSAATGLIGLTLMMLFTTETISVREKERFKLNQVLDVAKDRQFLVFCLFNLVLFSVMGQFASTLSVFSVDLLGISKMELGYLYTLNGIIVVFFQWPAALLAKRLGIRTSLVLGSLLYALGYLSVGLVPSFYFLLGSMVIITSGEVLHAPTSTTAVANMAPMEKTGRYMGFFGLAEAVGWSGGPFIGGFLLDGFPGCPIIIWGCIAVLGLIAATGFFTSLRQRKD